MRFYFLSTIIFLVIVLSFSTSFENWWKLPVFPANGTHLTMVRNAHRQRNPCNDSLANLSIPCNIWFTWKDMSEELRPAHIKDLVRKNVGWHAHYVDDTKMDRFMAEIFANTSLFWAYNLINPKLGASRSDIWRLAVLWIHGGAYLDYDVIIKKRFNEVLCY